MVSRKNFRLFHNYLLACGSEICAPLLRGLAKTFAPGLESPPRSWRRGLIISHTRIGDVLFRTCSLEQLKKGLPDCEWHYLAATDSAELLRGNPFLTSVLPLCDRAGCLRLLPGAARQLRAMEFDVALCTNSETYWQDHRVALEAGVPNRVGFAHRGLSGLLTEAVPWSHPSPWAGYFRRMVGHVTGLTPDWPLIPKIYASQEDERLALIQWEKMGMRTGTPAIACFMTTRERSQVWPADYYSEALVQVHLHSGAQIVLAGAKQDASVLGAFAARCKVPCKIMAGELGLRGLYCFLRKCAVVLSPDSGPRHIANAAGTPVVFMRNLYCSKVETGRYCSNEIDQSPDSEFVPVHEQESLLRGASPASVAQTLLQVLGSRV
jgi:heptosyltransferase II